MKKLATFSVLGLAVMVTGCVTSGGSANQIQTNITQASMLSEASSCQQLAQNIHALDQIIVSTNNYSGYNKYGYNSTTQAVNNTLYKSGKVHETPILGAIPDLMNTWNTSSTPTALTQQQARNAMQQKNRLVGIFQKKQCTQL